MKTLTSLVAKILYAVPMIIFGLFHLMNGSKMANNVPSFMPIPTFWVYLTGVALLAAGIAIITGYKVRLASLLLALLLALFAVLVHLPGVFDASTMQSSMPNFLKDTALAGGALLMAGLSK